MKYYLTTPIYYVNDLPHIGHAYTTVAADIIARLRRLSGEEVFFLTGTDEHGAKIAQAAAQKGVSPKDFCDTISGGFREAWQKLGITNDAFIRTTDPAHEKAVQAFLQTLFDKGMVYKKTYEGLYCVQCEKFLSPGDLNEDLCCPDHRTKPVNQAEENYFFRLSRFRETLIAILTDEKHPQHVAVYPVERRNEIVGKLNVSLEDISISRANLAWGIPLPFDGSQTAYVWVDALLNYITAIGYGDPSKSALFAKYWPADLHLMAKDILWFHSVIWPAMLLAAGVPLPRKLFAHGFFTIDGQKMSKTLGNVIRPDDLIARFGRDAARYLIISQFPFGTDGDISWKGMTQRYNTDLANNLGNLVSRTLTMLEKFSGAAVPAPDDAAPVPKIEKELLQLLTQAESLLKDLDFFRFISTIQSAIDRANRYIEETAPWKMAKTGSPHLPTVLYNLVLHVKAVTLNLVPVLPEMTGKIWEQLGEDRTVEQAAAAYFSSRDASVIRPRIGQTTRKAGILFPRMIDK